MQTKYLNLRSALTVNLISVAVAILILASSFKHMPNVTNFASGLYLTLVFVGYTGVIWFMLSLLCVLTHRLTKSFVLPALFITIPILFLFLDSKVYALYRSHLSVGLLEYVVKEAFSELKRLSYTDMLPLLFFFVFAWAISTILLKLIYRKQVFISKYNLIVPVYLAFWGAFVLSQLTYVYADVINYTPIKKWTRHIPMYHPLTARRSMVKWGLVDSSKLRKFEVSNKHKDSSINYPKDLACNKAPVKPNILWLFIDTWRFSDYTKEITPNIHQWVNSNPTHTFKNHWSVGNETIPSLFAIFYAAPGLYIKTFTESGITPIFISKLLEEDYQLQISTGWPIDNTSLAKNVFKEVPNLRVSIGDKEAWESDAYMQDEILGFLKKRDRNKPYFSFMIFDSAHDYSLPEDYDAPFKPFSKNLNYLALGPNTDPTKYHNKYKNSVHYIDSIIGKIIKSPLIHDEKRPTIVMITSDHGEQFNDLKKNFWGHSSNFSRYQLRVPMFINWGVFENKNPTAKTFEHMTTHNDMSHTFLESVFKCKPSSQQSVGSNLYDDSSRFPLLLSTYSRHGVLTKDKVFSYEIGTGYEVYDHDYNEHSDQEVPKEIFQQYLKASSQFYN